MRYWIGRVWLWLFGWRLATVPVEAPRFVLIAAPHTSNWDLPFMLATAFVMRIRVAWMGKHTLFRPPFGGLLRALGGVAVDRRSPHGAVAEAVAAFTRTERLVLAVPPEGTRRRVEHWKSGFYHIARGAGVPIGLGYLDFARRTCGIGGFVDPTGDVRADMDRIRAFYRDVRGRHPAAESVVRLREEDPG